MRYSRFTIKAIFYFILLTLSACASRPHNNVLLFGTDTKFALDISSEATQGSYPEVTLGYKRREAVYLPLARNAYKCREDRNTKKIHCTIESTSDKYMGKAEGDNTSNNGNDTYSVFASFGAKFDSGAKSSGGLAQFFATGVAAQRFGENPEVEKALSLRSGEAEAAIAEKEAIIAKANLELLQSELKDVAGEDEKIKAARESKINEIILCADLGNPEGKWKTIIEHAQTDSALSSVTQKWVARLKNKKENKYWKIKLRARDEVIKSMSTAVKKLCP